MPTSKRELMKEQGGRSRLPREAALESHSDFGDPGRVNRRRRRALRLLALWISSSIVLGIALFAQQAGSGAQPAAAAKRSRPGEGNVQPLDEYGFRQIFDGKTLTGWEGDPTFWRVENGIITGETATGRQPKQNTFLVWRGGSPADFELKVEYRLTGSNSGVQYRSFEVPGLELGMGGYQADMDGAQNVTGNIREERSPSDKRRDFAALRGQFTYIAEGKKPQLVGSLGEDSDLKKSIKDPDWNTLHIIARGNVLIQVLNGRVMSMLIDDDAPFRRLDGLIGIQVHTGPPMKIEVRNVRIRIL